MEKDYKNVDVSDIEIIDDPNMGKLALLDNEDKI